MDAVDKYILQNPHLTNREIGDKFGCALSTISWRRSLLGVKKMNLQYWTPTQVSWLKKLYTHMGDYEIALIFQEAYPKEKGWSLKHIEKKRNQLGLHRTKKQLSQIRERNKLFGCWKVGSKNTWKTRGESPIGEVRVWNGRQYIKTEQGFETYARKIWVDAYGPLKKGMNVVKINPLGPVSLENLETLTNAELGARNSISRYPYELRQAITTLNKLKKVINEKQNN